MIDRMCEHCAVAKSGRLFGLTNREVDRVELPM
jgi:hypothetical protein